jgi:hypothetical protein
MIAEMLTYCGGYSAAGIKTINGREGPGYDSKIFKDGRLLGQALNYGDGGSVRLHFPDYKDRDEFEAFAKARHPDHHEPADWFVTNVVAYWEAIKSLKAKSKKRILAVDPGDKSEVDGNGVNLAIVEFKAENTPENLARLKKVRPSYIWLNEALDAIDVPSARVPGGKKKSLPRDIK